MRSLFVAWVAVALGACAGRQQVSTSNQAAAAAPTASLESSSSVACTTDGECGVCYRQGSCGEAIAASDPTVDTPVCHVTPAPFCMPRRGRCEDGHCVAR